MNAAHDKHYATGTQAMARADDLHQPDTRLSAMVDGELDLSELDALLQSLDGEDEVRAACQRYQLIGDVLRGVPAPAASTPPHAFVAGVRARLQVQPAVVPSVPEPALAYGRAAAANDAVFRWKLVAGVASLAAVMAVSWAVIGGAPAASGGVSAGPQLALVQPAGALQAQAGATSAVLVNSPHGPVLRDPRLEELLAEHRQYGGMSALQMPAGFLRDATFDAAPQR